MGHCRSFSRFLTSSDPDIHLYEKKTMAIYNDLNEWESLQTCSVFKLAYMKHTCKSRRMCVFHTLFITPAVHTETFPLTRVYFRACKRFWVNISANNAFMTCSDAIISPSLFYVLCFSFSWRLLVWYYCLNKQDSNIQCSHTFWLIHFHYLTHSTEMWLFLSMF